MVIGLAESTCTVLSGFIVGGTLLTFFPIALVRDTNDGMPNRKSTLNTDPSLLIRRYRYSLLPCCRGYLRG